MEGPEEPAIAMARRPALCPARGKMREQLRHAPMPLPCPRCRRRTGAPGHQPWTDRQRRCAGALLPLAAQMSLLLLLSSFSVHAFGLQGRLRGDVELRLLEAEDRMTSAAQVLVGRIQRRHPCLLSLPLTQWNSAPCVSGQELDTLRQGELMGAAWQLLHWQPAGPSGGATGTTATLSLEIGLRPSGISAPPRSVYELRLAGPSPWRVQELLPLGLRGERP
ncbi:MAG: hypothetical protein ACKO0M_16000 [Cyanobium sp.]